MFGFQRRLVRRCEWLTAHAEDRLLAAHVADGCHGAHLAYQRSPGTGPDAGPVASDLTYSPARCATARPASTPPICAPASPATATRSRAHQEELNRLNVYPVPDGDTGTNMALTLESVVERARRRRPSDMAAVCKAISHGSLMGARGNSGVILSQILRGLADVFREPTRSPTAALRRRPAPRRPTRPTGR